MINIENLEIKFKDQVALSIKENIKINYNEKIGIIGSNGAGKSILLKAILGIVKYKGIIQKDFNSNDISIHLQENDYSSNVSIKCILETILNTNLKNDNKLKELIEYFKFDKCLKKKFKNLSGGEKQKVTLILVLYKDSKITFFDEITSGLDFTTRESLMKKIYEWYKNKERTICIVSHYYKELEDIVDKLLILDKGNLIDYGQIDELFKKYCGKSLFVFENDYKINNIKEYLKKFNQIENENSIIISVNSIEEELEIAKLLIENNIDFKKSSKDIEAIFIAAKKRYYGGKNEY